MFQRTASLISSMQHLYTQTDKHLCPYGSTGGWPRGAGLGRLIRKWRVASGEWRAKNQGKSRFLASLGMTVEWDKQPRELHVLAKLVFRFWRDARGVAKEFHEAVALGFSRTLLEKVSSRFNDTNFFRDGGSNPLVQGHAVLFREALGGLLDGVRKLQWISSSTHGYILFKTSIGRRTETPKRSAATAKSETLYVTRASASPLMAASSTISSPGSATCGLHRKCNSTGSTKAASSASKSSICSGASP